MTTPQGSEPVTTPEVDSLDVISETSIVLDLKSNCFKPLRIEPSIYEFEDTIDQIIELQSVLESTRSFLSLQMLILDTPKAYKLLESTTFFIHFKRLHL